MISDTEKSNPELKRALNAIDLIFLGIGAIVGAGIFVITGIAAATKAGPAIMLSYILSASACAFTALSYAELAASIGGCGSVYQYASVSFGELVAWIIGWDLILEYAISVAAVSVGWSSYMNNLFQSMNIHLPSYFLTSPLQGGIINLPALLIVVIIATVLCIGIKESSRFNIIIVLIKLAAIVIFSLIAAFHFNLNNWHPFMPYGWNGIMRGAAIVFFSYIGFDAVATAAEETIHPQRNLPRGIIGSLIVCTVLYISVSGLLTGMTPYSQLDVSSPISHVLLQFGYNFAANIISIGALAGITTVILVMYFGLTRVTLAMSRDGMLPKRLSNINSTTKTPVRIILMSGIVIACLSGLIPIEDLVEMANIGTLSAFIIVCGGVIVLRYTKPNMPRPFKTPFSPIIPALGILFCLYLMFHLPILTWIRFLVWLGLGMIIYFSYGRGKIKNKIIFFEK